MDKDKKEKPKLYDNNINKIKDNKDNRGTNGGNKNNKNNSNPGNNTSVAIRVFLVALLSLYLINLFFGSGASKGVKEIRYDQFMDMIENDYIKAVEYQSDRFIITPKEEDVETIETQVLGNTVIDSNNGTVLTPAEIASKEQTEIDITTNPENSLLNTEKFLKSVMESENAYVRGQQMEYYTGRVDDTELLPLLKANDVEITKKVINNNPFMIFLTSWVLPLVFIYGIMMLVMYFVSKKMGGSGGIMGVGKSNAKMYNKEDVTGVTFNDVAGQEEAKESLREIVDYLNKPEKYREIGAKQPKGALLVGPPGTGKTLLAKAVAGEAKVSFLSLSGSEFVEMFVGVGASRVRDLFKTAAANAPCIIFIDEIDAIGKSRDNQMGGNDEREQTLNQLLAEMDGFDSTKAIVILAATNRPEVLDKALLRPGRFDRQIIVEKPDLKGREDILKVHLAKVKYDKNIDIRKMALATAGATGADLANMVNEAALRAVRHNRKEVTQNDLMESVEVIIAGKEKKDRILSDRERRIVAYHEVGHALTAALQKHTQPVQKITIVPRTMGALGYTMQMPEEEKYLRTKDELTAEIVVFSGGRAAEEVVFNVATTGASNDIERATDIARKMMSMYGMSDTFGMMALESVQSRYLDGRAVSNASETTKARLDEEVRLLMQQSYEKAVALLVEYRDALDEIAEYLLAKETIFGDEFMRILKKYNDDIIIAEDDEQISLNSLDDNKKDDEKVLDVVVDDSTKTSLDEKSDSEVEVKTEIENKEDKE